MTAAAFAVVFAMVLLPGIGLARACAPPGQMLLETRVALAVGLGYAGAALVATLLTAAHAMRPVPFALGIALLTAAAWAAGRPQFGQRAASPPSERLPPADRLLTGGSLAIVAAFTVAHLTVSPAENFGSVSSFRYWADGLEIADAGRIPDHTIQWGVAQVSDRQQGGAERVRRRSEPPDRRRAAAADARAHRPLRRSASLPPSLRSDASWGCEPVRSS